ncbi:MAG: tetratricopeptide repeat protein [Desulfuromonadaceae bacterium]|nr:tetratricopeptide repeat protein [Desulfuromonadaceae bacterium]
MLDSQLFGLNPRGFHLVNALLHGVNASLLFLLLRSMTGAVWRSAFVAACFALHPLHVESVVWIAERKDVLSTLFLILTLFFYSGYLKQTKRSLYLLSLTAFALGLMAKPMLVTVPIILLLLDYWPFDRLRLRLFSKIGPDETVNKRVEDGYSLRFLLIEKIPFVLLAAISSILTLFAQKTNISNFTNVPLLDRCSNALLALVVYLKKMLFPFDLAIIYPLVQVPLWKAVAAAAILSAITIMAIKYGSKYRYLAAGWFWYLITLMPVIGIIQVGRQAFADRYTYIPFIGLFIMVSWGGTELCSKLPAIRKFSALAAVGIVILLSAATWFQLGYWRDNFTLFSHALEVTEKNYFAHYSLGLVYEQQKKPELAIAEYMKSIQIEPREPIVHFDLGFLLDAQGNSSEGIKHLKEAIILDPGFAQAHFTLGIILGNLGKMSEAIRELDEALRIEPDNTKYLNNLGVVLAQQGGIDDAIVLFSKAIRLNPNDEKAHENLKIALHQKSLLVERK